MVQTGKDDLRLSIMKSLKSVSASTEAVYLKMGEIYPQLIKELEKGATSHSSPNSVHSQSLLGSTIEETLRALDEKEKQFFHNQKNSEHLLEQLDMLIQLLGTLGLSTQEIREDSFLMEIISLNAMIIAAKTGQAGRAFACITSELKDLSGQTIELTEQMDQMENSINRVFSEFKINLSDMNSKEQERYFHFIKESKDFFQNLNLGAVKLWEGIEDIRAKTIDVKIPLVKIMVEIQNQDRIRQSIDHVLLSLQELGDPEASVDLESRLDHLSLLELLPELSKQVLDEISTHIKENRETFHIALENARGLINNLEDQRKIFLFEQQKNTTPNNLEYLFHQGKHIFTDFITQTESLLRIQEGAFRKSHQLQIYVKGLSEMLQSFGFIVSKFRNIDMASRIQVARLSSLSSMKSNTLEMTALTQKIELDVHQSMLITTGFYTRVQDVFQSYEMDFNHRIKADMDFQKRLADSTNNLEKAKNIILKSVQESQVFTQTFVQQFQKTEGDLSTLDGLLIEIEKQKSSLDQMRQRVVLEKKELMATENLTTWTLKNEKLKTLIDRFTIFSHKKLAADLGNFEVEDSVDAGEVTLF